MKFKTFLSFLLLVAVFSLCNPGEAKYRKVVEEFVTTRQPELKDQHHSHVLQGLTYHDYVVCSIAKLDGIWIATGYLTTIKVRSHDTKHRKVLYPFGDPITSLPAK